MPAKKPSRSLKHKPGIRMVRLNDRYIVREDMLLGVSRLANPSAKGNEFGISVAAGCVPAKDNPDKPTIIWVTREEAEHIAQQIGIEI